MCLWVFPVMGHLHMEWRCISRILYVSVGLAAGHWNVGGLQGPLFGMLGARAAMWPRWTAMGPNATHMGSRLAGVNGNPKEGFFTN